MAELDPGAPHLDIAGYVLHKLTAREREDFEAHVATCPGCQQELEELRRAPGLLGQAAEPMEVPAGLRSRVLEAVAREPAPRGIGPAPASRLQPAGPRLRWGQAWALAATAALVIVFLAGVGTSRLLSRFSPPETPLAPVVETVHLTAAPGATGSGVAVIRQTGGGRAIELTVRGLPPPPAGHFYTCWLVADDDTLQHQDRVSVGSFTTSGTRPLTLRWETAADLGRYPHLGVTLEPDNGSPLHQGPKVLVATG